MAVRARLTSNAGELAKRWQGRAAGVRGAEERAAQQTRPVLRANVAKYTPVKTGELLGGLYVTIERRGDRIALVAGFRGVKHARPVEFGTRPHLIRPRKRAALAFDVNGFPVVTREVQHPGTKGAHMQEKGARETRPVFRRNLRRELRRLYLGVR